MVNGSVSNCHGGSILTKYAARNVCSVTAEEAQLHLLAQRNNSLPLVLIILREVKLLWDHIKLNHSKSGSETPIMS